ncbi:MAG: enoyl-CoA hydratase-related protein [Sphingobium sp.]
MGDWIETNVADGVATLSLNRPEARNAVNPLLLAELTATIARCEADPAVRVLVLTGTGPVFSAGGDLKGLNATAQADRPEEADLLAAALAPARALLMSPKPSICLLRGAVAGGGLALALGCDFRLAVSGTKIVFAYGRIGLAGDLGATWLLADLIGPRAAFRFAMRNQLIADEARAIGLVDAVADEGDIDALLAEHVAMLLATPPAAAAAIKANLRAAASLDYDAAGTLEADTFGRLRRTADHREAIDSFLTRRTPRFTGA